MKPVFGMAYRSRDQWLLQIKSMPAVVVAISGLKAFPHFLKIYDLQVSNVVGVEAQVYRVPPGPQVRKLGKPGSTPPTLRELGLVRWNRLRSKLSLLHHG